MRDFDLDRRFALVLIPFRAFQVMLTPEDQQTCVLTIRRHLRPGGKLIVDIFDPLYEFCFPGADVPGERPSAVHPESGNVVTARATNRVNDPIRQQLSEDWVFTELAPDGAVLREETERLRMRWTHRQEARYLWKLTGYEIVAEYSDFQRSTPAYGREQIWVVTPR
jgi:hypothetical protein